MIYTKAQVDLAHNLAAAWHSDQIDKAGLPYFLHPKAVASMASTNELKIIAYLHDTVEDCEVSLDDIEYHFDKNIRQAIDAITKRKNETYREYLVRLTNNNAAVTVKFLDIAHNTSKERMEHLPKEVRTGLFKKYEKGINILVEALRKKNK